MNSISALLKSFLMFSGLFLLFSGFRDKPQYKEYQENMASVEVSLDDIKPGTISLTQINSLKNLVIRSDGRNYNAKSYEIGIVPYSSPSQFIKWYGNNLPQNALLSMKKLQPGDLIIIVHLVIYGMDKYQMVSDPKWTVSK